MPYIATRFLITPADRTPSKSVFPRTAGSLLCPLPHSHEEGYVGHKQSTLGWPDGPWKHGATSREGGTGISYLTTPPHCSLVWWVYMPPLPHIATANYLASRSPPWTTDDCHSTPLSCLVLPQTGPPAWHKVRKSPVYYPAGSTKLSDHDKYH